MWFGQPYAARDNGAVPECPECGAQAPAGARFCPACGTRFGAAPTAIAERKLATVVFADLVGSTALGSGQDPERTRAMLERFYDSMAAEVARAGGTVEKFAGDAVMAAFGAPLALEDHPERALHASLAMQRAMGLLFDGRLALRIGVDTGEIVVGRPREGSSFVTGDAVNVAARLEQAAAPGEILAGDRTAAMAGTAFRFGEKRRFEARGKEGGVIGVPVLGAVSVVRPRGLGARPSAFVGRSVELELLLATYARAVERRAPHLVTIVGDAGLGKTRLVAELSARLDGMSPVPLRRTGRCLAYGRGITYWPLGEVLREQFGLSDGDSPGVVRARLRPREVLALSLGLEPAPEMHPLEARDRLHEAWAELLTEVTTARPVLIVVEDLHWAEQPLLDLLDRLARDVRGPLLIVGTARPELFEVRGGWGDDARNASHLWLEPLRPDEISELAQTLTMGTMPGSLIARLADRAEGNPFFAEEMLASLVDRGLAGGEEGAALELPDTVQAVVAARIDMLPPAEKATLQAGAVVGRTFWERAVRELVGGEQPGLELLEARDFVRRLPGSSFGGAEYAFRHAVTREVAYSTLPKGRRARLHAGFAAWLEETGHGRDEDAPLLAHHYASAARPDDVDLAWGTDPEALVRLRARACLWLRRAGELAVARYDLDDGIVLLHRAAELEDDEVAQAELWREIGRANAIGFRGPEFLDAMQRSLERTSDPAVRGATYAELAYQTSFRAAMWPTAPNPGTVSSWVDQALALTEPGTAARCKALIASAFWSTTTDTGPAREALAIAGTLGDDDLAAAAYRAESLLARRAGRHLEAIALAERPLELVGQLHDPEEIIEVYEALIPTQSMLCRFGEARDTSFLHERATQRLTPHHRLHGVAVRAELEELCAAWPTIRELQTHIEGTVADNRETPCIRNQRSLLVCALACLAVGEVAEADRLEEAAQALAMEGYDLQLSAPRLRMALLRDDTDALERLVDARTDVTSRDLSWWSISADVARLDALLRLGQRDRVEEEAAPLLDQTGTYVEPFALRALGRLRADRDMVAHALEQFEALGLSWHAEQTRRAIAR